tara:strand:+ start:199 stop:1098 length:900 start_codon:yes stop_codon:yes gene_type:complete
MSTPTPSYQKRRRDKCAAKVKRSTASLERLQQEHYDLSLERLQRERDDLQVAIMSVVKQISVEEAVLASCRRDLKQAEDDLFWSSTTDKPWPRDIILKITGYSGIEDDICFAQLKGNATWTHVDQLVSPLRKKLHLIQHFFFSGSVAKYRSKITMVLKIYGRHTKWKGGTSYLGWASLMNSELFQPKRFTAMGMTLTLFGPVCLVQITVGSPAASAYVERHENTILDKIRRQVDELRCNPWGVYGRSYYCRTQVYFSRIPPYVGVEAPLTINIQNPDLNWSETTIVHGGTPNRLAYITS